MSTDTGSRGWGPATALRRIGAGRPLGPLRTASSAVSNRTDVVDWQHLYDRVGERVFRLMHRMLGDPDEAADLTHDVFVRVHEKRAQFDGKGSVDAWVFRIAANLARDTLRARRIRGALEPRVVEAVRGSLLARGQPDPELLMVLNRTLAQLEEPLRVVLLLHDVDGYRHREIAELLDIAAGTSKARLSLARRRMREALDRQGIR